MYLKQVMRLFQFFLFFIVFCSAAYSTGRSGSSKVGFAGLVKIDSFKLARKHGFENIDMLNDFKRDLPKNPWSNKDKVKFMDEELFNPVKKLYEEVKDLKMEDCLPNSKSIKMVIGLSHFKTAAEYYFKNREKALSMYGEAARKKQGEAEATKKAKEEKTRLAEKRTKERVKIDPLELAKKLGFPDRSSVNKFDNNKVPRDGFPLERWADNELYNRIKTIYSEIKNLRYEDFYTDTKTRQKMVWSLQSLKERINNYLPYRVHALRCEEIIRKHGFSTECEFKDFCLGIPQDQEDFKGKFLTKDFEQKVRVIYEDLKTIRSYLRKFSICDSQLDHVFGYHIENYVKNIDKVRIAKDEGRKLELEREKKRKGAPQRATIFFKKTPKPKDFAEIKRFVSLLPKVEIKVVETGTGYAAPDDYIWNIFSSVAWKNHLIFREVPLSAASYKNKLMWIGAKITRKLREYFVLMSDQEEALAKIPNKILVNKDLRLNTSYVIICRLEEVTTVKTISGSTKQITVVKVEGIFPYTDLITFRQYIVAHPEEVPQNTHITYEPSSSR